MRCLLVFHLLQLNCAAYLLDGLPTISFRILIAEHPSSRLLLQVVLTDLPHILPLTQENLELNFPLTSPAAASTGNSIEPSNTAGTFGRRSHAVGRCSQAEQGSASTTKLEGAAMLGSADHGHQLGGRQQHQSAALSASAAFAAAICSSSPGQPAAELQQQQQCASESGWQVFTAGPLVVEYSWGQPAEQLQQRVAAAAAARLNTAASHAAVQQSQQEQEDHHQQQQQLDDGYKHSSLPLAFHHSRAYDYVVGADLLYDPTYHQALLTSLQQLCAPHAQVCSNICDLVGC
jgi:hypothetical protein